MTPLSKWGINFAGLQQTGQSLHLLPVIRIRKVAMGRNPTGNLFSYLQFHHLLFALLKKKFFLRNGWKLKWKFVVISGLAIVITSQPHHIRSGQEYVNVRITSLDYILQKVFEDQHGIISNAKSKRWTFIMWRPSFPCDFFTRLNATFGLICGLRSGFLWTLFP